MSKYVNEKVVGQCFHSCPFFRTSSDGMECGHPCFEDKTNYESMIITQKNSRGRVPDECPLRNSNEGKTEVTLRVVLNQNEDE